MFRSMSTRRGYQKLGKETDTTGLLNKLQLKRSTSVPSSGFNLPQKKALQGPIYGNINLQRNPTKKGNNNSKKSHPLFSFLYRKKKATARADMGRYLEYVREGGMWDLTSNKPIMYYK